MAYLVDVQVDPAEQPDMPLEWFEDVVRAVLAHAGEPPEVEVSLLLTTDAQIQELNRAFRGLDEPTDVLSFAAREGDAFVVPAVVAPYLGDIAISLPAARRQAAEAGHSVRDELALLVVHGCLHLLGHDHATPEEEAAMWALQGEILRGLQA